MLKSFTLLDQLILVAYLLALTAAGFLFQRGQKTTEDYLLAGKNMGWIPVGISIVASLISGISYIGIPAEIRSYGLGFVVYALSYILIVPIVMRFILPFYGGLRITTAYEYLEGRFSVTVRRVASGMFITWRLLWIATVIYVPSLVLSTLTGLPLIPTVIAVGTFTTLYTSLGGMKAVIWTDFTQFFVIIGGAALTIYFVATSLDGGVREIWERAHAAGRLYSFSFSLNPTERLTVWGALIGGAFANLAFFTADQMIIQRYLTTRSARDLKRTFILNCFGLTLTVALLSGVGLALFAFYHANPELFPEGLKKDNVFPHFISQQFPPGLVGLLMASILSATTSALAAGINAVTTAIYRDFIASSAHEPPGSSREGLRLSRAITVSVGALATVMACFLERIGTIMEIAVRFVDGFAGPLLAIFLLGIFSARVQSIPVLLGGLTGVLTSAYFNFYSHVSFAWYPAIGCLAALLSGLAFHVFLPGWLGGGKKLAPIRDAD